jgi:iron complex outermembrane receptor protein
MGTYYAKFDNHHFKIHANYTYTKSVNKKTRKELIYVPNHKASSQINYQYKKISTWIQAIYQGSVFTSSDNAYSLPAYPLVNFGVNYQFQTPKMIYKLGAQTQNLTHENYQNVVARPMPGRNYQLYLTLNL